MFRSRSRKWRAAVALNCVALQENTRDYLTKVPSILGQADTSYQRGQNVLVRIPSGCDYWLDERKLVIAKQKKLCKRCGSFLIEYDGICSCPSCDGML